MDCGLLYINSNIPTVVEEMLIYPIRNPLEKWRVCTIHPFPKCKQIITHYKVPSPLNHVEN